MSYTVVTPGAKPRPATVTTASALLYVAAALQLVSIVVSLLSFGPIQDAVNEQFAGDPDADAIATTMQVFLGIGIAIAALFAIGTIVLGIFVGRGKNAARIVTWVLAGIGVLCYGCTLGSTAFTGAMNSSLGASDPESVEVQRRIEDAIPEWQNTAGTIESVLLLLLFLAVIILLALPASNEFFRREQEVWVPPTYPPAGGPGLPPPAGGPTYPPAGGSGLPPAGGPTYPPAGGSGLPPAGGPGMPPPPPQQ
jgi:hypothetical protein